MRVAIIPARGGSVRLPRKNIRMFHGKPIIGYSIETAKSIFDEVCVSTDDDEIEEVARQYGAKVLRRPTSDGSEGTQEVTRGAALSAFWPLPDVVCCLYPTAPLVKPSDIFDAFVLHASRGCTFVVSVGAEPLRDAGAFYVGNGRTFVDRVPLWSSSTGIVVLPEERVCDVNTLEDFESAERMYAALHP